LPAFTLTTTASSALILVGPLSWYFIVFHSRYLLFTWRFTGRFAWRSFAFVVLRMIINKRFTLRANSRSVEEEQRQNVYQQDHHFQHDHKGKGEAQLARIGPVAPHVGVGHYVKTSDRHGNHVTEVFGADKVHA